MAEIVLRGVSKVYAPDVVAAEDVNLEIRDGEFMVLLGPSGCGKSTTLRMIAGLEEATSGEIFIGARRMNDVDPAERNLAIVFQNYALYPHMTVAGNLAFGLKLRRVPRDDIDRRITKTASMLGIEALLSRRPRELSGGQQQRVALGRALVREPAAFLLDEPLSNLDAKLRAAMRTELIKIHRELGATIVHVTHDQVEAMTMGQRMCIMRDGRVVQVGSPLEVYRNPVDTFVAGFLASPPMNLLEATVLEEAGMVAAELGGVRLALGERGATRVSGLRERGVIVGIRPEDLYAQAPPDLGCTPIEVRVIAIEALGPEVVLVAALRDGREISARLGRDFAAAPGSRLRLFADRASIHLFDPESGRAVGAGDRSEPGA